MALSDIHWVGLKSIEVIADVLPGKIAGKRLSEAYKYALQPTEMAMKNNVPIATGKLVESIGINVTGMQDMQQMKALVGPRRKRYTWNMQGWHSHLIESGTKKHNIVSKKDQAMPMYKFKKLVGFAKQIMHPGTTGTFPFRRAIDATWEDVGTRVSEKVSEIMSAEIKSITHQFGNVASR